MDDLISRAAANDAYCMHECGMKYTECDDEYCGSILDDIPSAQPERKKGKWIIRGKQMVLNLENAREQYSALGYPHRNIQQLQCSECRKITLVDESILYEYCPHCGCDMRQEGEDHGTTL